MRKDYQASKGPRKSSGRTPSRTSASGSFRGAPASQSRSSDAPRTRSSYVAHAKRVSAVRTTNRTPTHVESPSRASSRSHAPMPHRSVARDARKQFEGDPELPTAPEYPMRINKYLARKGLATRKAADELIIKERVLINGAIATLGDRVLETDEVSIRAGRGPKQQHFYYAYNKPRGVITHSPQGEEIEVQETLPTEAKEKGLFPVGRLDKDSHGLLLLTNDGRITDRLLSPGRAHEKEYAVRVKFPLRASFKTNMEAGVDIEGYQTLPAKIKGMGEKSFSIVLTEGKKHQIRRMVVAMHNEVDDLKRVRILNIKIGTLGKGALREIVGAEQQEFLKLLGLVA